MSCGLCLLGGAAATLAAIGTGLVVTAFLPEEIAGSMIGTAVVSVVSIGTRTFSDATTEAAWKTWIDTRHETYQKEKKQNETFGLR